MNLERASQYPSQPQLARRAWIGVFGVLIGWHLLAAWALPVTQDEAYYFDWSRHLAWGYFDHPPGVAVMGLGVLLQPGSVWVARLGTVLASALTLWVLFSWYRRSGLAGRPLLIALLLAGANLPLLVYGFIDNPDVLLLLFWALAMHQATVALQGRRRRWLGVGIAVGLGLLSKYTMVLILPVLLWGLWRGDARGLRTPWPWLGLLLALLIALPNQLWNLSHGGGSLLYQLQHGVGAAGRFTLPNPISGFAPAAPAATTPPAHPHPGIGGVFGYLGAQLAVFGLLLLPFVREWLARLRRRPAEAADQAPDAALLPGLRALLWAGVLVPLVFFGLFAAIAKVQANWPAPWLLSAAPLAALYLRRRLSWVWAGALLNLLVLSLVLVHANTGWLPIKPNKDRVMRETHGYQALAEQVARLPGRVFADRYQLTAMLRFYQPSLAVTQWPGISRPSEYISGSLVPYPTLAQLQAADGFWLVTGDPQPAPIKGFVPRLDRELFDCEGRSLSSQSCVTPVHRWFIYRYRDRTEPASAN